MMRRQVTKKWQLDMCSKLTLTTAPSPKIITTRAAILVVHWFVLFMVMVGKFPFTLHRNSRILVLTAYTITLRAI